MSSENLFVVESEVTKILCLHFLIESNSTTSVNLKTELFNNCLFSFTNHNDMEKHLSLYFSFSSMKRLKCQTSVLLKKYLFFIQIIKIYGKIYVHFLISFLLLKD